MDSRKIHMHLQLADRSKFPLLSQNVPGRICTFHAGLTEFGFFH